MRFYSRAWNEARGGAGGSWGKSQWFFATDDAGNVSKQVELYSGGQVLRYDETYVEDMHGRLAEKPLDLVEFEPFSIAEELFLQVWPAETPPGPAGDIDLGRPRMHHKGAPGAIWASRSLLAVQAVLATLLGAGLLLFIVGLAAIGCSDAPASCNVIGIWGFVAVVVLNVLLAWSMAVMPWIKRRWIPAAVCTGELILVGELIALLLYSYVKQPATLYSPTTPSGAVWIDASVLLPILIIGTALAPTARRYYGRI
jgi:hypothetical protein